MRYLYSFNLIVESIRFHQEHLFIFYEQLIDWQYKYLYNYVCFFWKPIIEHTW